jgi:hypothetical protein
MDASRRIPGHKVPVAAANLPTPSCRSSSKRYVANLEAKLALTERQMGAWELFAECLRANRDRMQAFDDRTEQPFGPLEDRLAALDAMQRAATELFAVLDTLQQQTATQLLPLCCLPRARKQLADATSADDHEFGSIAELIEELERNAAYYSGGPDRDAGDLLWRAAKALTQRC